MTVESDINVYVNERLELTDTITSDGTSLGTATDITGWTLRAVIHAKRGDGAPLLTYTTGSGIAVPTGNDGVLIITLPKADIALLGVGDFFFYVERTDAGGEATLSIGEFHVLPI